MQYGRLRGKPGASPGQARNDDTAKSRRDDTLLTVGFNLRKETRHATSLQSPAGTTLCTYNMCRNEFFVIRHIGLSSRHCGLDPQSTEIQPHRTIKSNLIVQNADIARHPVNANKICANPVNLRLSACAKKKIKKMFLFKKSVSLRFYRFSIVCGRKS